MPIYRNEAAFCSQKNIKGLSREKTQKKMNILMWKKAHYLPFSIAVNSRAVVSHTSNLFFQLIARRYEKTSTVFISNKTFSQWNEALADVTIVSAILDHVLHHCTVINIKCESYRLKERKEFMRQKQMIVNTLFDKILLAYIPFDW